MMIEINGKTIGIKFNQYAYKVFGEFVLQSKSEIAQLYAYVWAGYEGWKFVKEEAPGSTFIAPILEFEEIVDWVESAAVDQEVFNKIAQIKELFTGGALYKKALQIIEEQKKSE